MSMKLLQHNDRFFQPFLLLFTDKKNLRGPTKYSLHVHYKNSMYTIQYSFSELFHKQ